jgi:hypothetical protein
MELTPNGPIEFTDGMHYSAFASDGRSDQAAVRLTAVQQPVTINPIKFTRWDLAESEARMGPNTNEGGGKRVFPDLPYPTSAHGAYWGRAAVKVTINPPKAKQALYAWAYDVDDPSASVLPVDDDVTPKPADNRTPFVTGQPWSILAVGTTDAAGVAWFWLDLSMKPGDNYRMVVSLTQAEQSGIYPKQPQAEGKLFKGQGEAAVEVTDTATLKVSEMLTVWRELHVEVDSMGKVAGQTAPQKGADPNDDFLDNGEEVPAPDTSTLDSAMNEAYVKVLTDLPGDDSVDFRLNVEFYMQPPNPLPPDDFFNITRRFWNSRRLNANNFWVAYVLGPSKGLGVLTTTLISN